MKQGNLKINCNPKTLFLVFFCLLILSQSKCSDRPQCFKKVVFNYNLPEMNLYQMNGTDNNLIEYSIKAYGDFNNDLYTDFIGVSENRYLLVFVWNSDRLIYEKVFETQMINGYTPKSIYLLDVSADGWLDFVVWGFKTISESQSQNCLVPYVRQIVIEPDQLKLQNMYDFKDTTILTMPETTDPIIVGYKLETQTDGVGFLLFMNGERVFLTYKDGMNADSSFHAIKWNAMVQSQSDFSKKPFYHEHRSAFVDLAGDCVPELAILNEDKKIQIWIGDSKKFRFSRFYDVDSEHNNLTLSGFAFNDINYDGGIDFILVFDKMIRVHLNHRSLTVQDQFCCPGCTNIDFDGPIDIGIPEGKTVKPQAIHFGDINIDGYPDMLLVLVDDTTKAQTPILFENLFDVGTNSFTPFKTPIYNDRLSATPEGRTVLSASFIDILQNGILDMVVSYNNSGKFQTFMFYNNFLFQNDFYIKGFGLFGPSTKLGTQFPGMSLYWVNSVNDGFKITYQAQITQTSYDALQMPYTFCGLGRANNYVQTFTVGRNGIKEEWSPIIPNSQLGIYTINDNSDTQFFHQKSWKIKIFAFPFYEFITVIIVTVIVLTIFGLFLMYAKCKGYKKKEQPLEIQFIN